MPSPFSLGAQNADRVFDGFVDGDVGVGAHTFTTAETVYTVAHGMSAAPDWVLLTCSDAAIGAEGLGWSATATTLTINLVDTNAGEPVVSWLAGNLS